MSKTQQFDDHFDYSHANVTIREDLAAAYRQFWQALSQPGSGWSGSERIAIAQETRYAKRCGYCQQRKQALSPYSFGGEHEHAGHLNDRAVDAVHRIITDQGRITQAWIDDNIENGLSEVQYVELVGISVTVLSIDEFHRALGLPLEPLPEPQPGKPDGYRPALAERGTGFVAMLPADKTLSGREAGLWPKNRTANVVRALSLVPDAVKAWGAVAAAQYLPFERMVDFGGDTGRSIDRMQMELVAGRVSAVNECFY